MCTKDHCSFRQQKTPPKGGAVDGGAYKEFTYSQRCKIEGYRHDQKGVREIARLLGKGKSAVAKEIGRGRHRDGGYCADKAHRRRYLKRRYAKTECTKIVENPELRRFVDKRLHAGQSPESISGATYQRSGIAYASEKAIRRYIGTRPGLERCLFWHRNNKKGGPKRATSSERLTDRRFIDERPRAAEYEYGHWEGDFIISKESTWVLLVLVEKCSKQVKIRRLPKRDNGLVNEAVVGALEGYTVRSLTLDNDIAFKKHCELETKLGAPIYFTHPYCSWEKGLVENTNRWIRQFVPKRADIGAYGDDAIQNIEDWMNHLPRPCLAGKTAYEMMRYKENDVRVTSWVIGLPVTVH